MALEAATSIYGLNAAYPLYQDVKQEGDDHIRLIKTVLTASFIGLGGALYRGVTKSSNFSIAASDGGAIFECSGEITGTLPAGPTNGFFFLLSAANDTAITVNTNAGAFFGLVMAMELAICRWNGTEWKLAVLNQTDSPGSHVETYLSLSSQTHLPLRGGSIGMTGSGATFAGPKQKRLFSLLWDVIVIVIQDSGGVGTTRGASWSADWAVQKRLVLPDGRGRVFADIDSSAGRLSQYLTATLGAVGGTEQPAQHDHTTVVSSFSGAHAHTYGGTANFTTAAADVVHGHSVSLNTSSAGNHGHTVAGGSSILYSAVTNYTYGDPIFASGYAAGGAAGIDWAGEHIHGVSGSTAGASINHAHNGSVTLSGSTGSNDLSHAHTVTVNSSGSGTTGNIQPTFVGNRYIRL